MCAWRVNVVMLVEEHHLRSVACCNYLSYFMERKKSFPAIVRRGFEGRRRREVDDLRFCKACVVLFKEHFWKAYPNKHLEN